MLFLRTLLFHLLFILHGLLLVFSADIDGRPHSNALVLKGMESLNNEEWLRKGNNGGNPNDIIDFMMGGGHIKFRSLGQQGGNDVYLTEQNKNHVLGTWRPMPGSVPFERRLDELTLSLGGGGIITHDVRTPRDLPILSQSPAFHTEKENLPLGLGELEGDWYRVLTGPSQYGSNKHDAIRIEKNDQSLGAIMMVNRIDWIPYSTIKQGRVLGGWRSCPKPGGFKDQLLLFSVVGGELHYKLTSPGGPYNGQWIPISRSKPSLPPRPQSPQRYGSPPPYPPPPQNQGWKAKLSSKLSKLPSMFRQQPR